MTWRAVKFREVISMLSGFAFEADLFNTTGNGLPVVRIRDVVRGYSETFYDGPFDKKFIVKDGDFLIGMDGEFNISAWRGGDALLNQRVCKIDTVDERRVDKNYLAYFLSLALKKIEDATPFVTVKHLSIKTLNSLDVPLPPLAEQQRIAAILDCAAALRAKRRATLAKLDELLQATFIEMFGEPVTNPKGWDICPLSDCLVGSASNGFFAKGDKYTTRGTPIIWISDFIDLFYAKVDNIKRVEANAKDIAKNQVRYGDVLFCRSSLTPAGIGKASIIPPGDLEGTIFECHIIKCTLNQSVLLPEFFRVFSDTPYFRQQILKHAKTATMTTISQQGIVNNKVFVPPLEMQQKFKEACNQILTQRELSVKSLAVFDTFFHSLQQRAFRGNL
ncbi:MAG TPA: restriction endonuclease subunit S [Herpetosiphonaceae bacterium]|nr:restriction endonuclease subunit S [Herpetosiphonaceae bacterium]